MDLKTIIISQYHAALEMLRLAIARCPDDLWLDENYANRFWHVAYHALFYTHLYLQPQEEDFSPWEKHRERYNYMGPTPWPPHEKPVADVPYTRDEILAYLDHCRQEVEARVPGLDLHGPSGFSWIPLSKVELQFYSIRHLQQHAGELCERLGVAAGVDVPWVGHGPAAD